jgi:hypothetical protein
MTVNSYKTQGWIRLYRKILDWEWYDISEMVHLFLHLLISANSMPGEWRGVKVNRGQLITGLHSLNRDTGISIQRLRTCLKRLRITGEITINSTNKYSIITICNYDEYNKYYSYTNKQINNQSTINQQSTNKQATTNKNNKNIKNNNIKEPSKNFSGVKKSDFIDLVIEQFCLSYQEFRETEYQVVNKGKERSSAAKILNIYKEKNSAAGTEKTIQDLRTYFDLCVQVDNTWMRDNMSLSMIVNKYNEINTILRHGKTGKTNETNGATDAELAEIVASKFAIDKD